MLGKGEFRVILWPNDFAATYAFYKNGLELAVDHEWDYDSGDKGVVFLAGGGMIELLARMPEQAFVAPQGVGVLIQVDDADHWFGLAQQRGLKVIQEPVSYPWGHRVTRLQDPDGLVVSLFSPV